MGRLLTISALALVWAAPSVAQAEQATGGAAAPKADSTNEAYSGEIVVTAQRREQRLQEIPLAVTAVSARTLANTGTIQSTDLKLVSPSLDIRVTSGYTNPYIRGVGSRALGPGVESPVAFYVDGIYIGNGSSVLNFSNIERVEVLKGPQGTLFGRNATGGLVQVVTKDPSSYLSGDASVEYGSYDTFRSTAYISGPLSQGVSADIGGYFTTQGEGYGKNLTTGADTYRTKRDYGIRSKWLFELGAATIRLTGDYSNNSGSNNTLRIPLGQTPPPPLGPVYGGSPWDTSSEINYFTRQEQGGASVRVDVDAGFADVVSTTAYRKSNFAMQTDFDVTAFAGRTFDQVQKDRQFSQELQLLSKKDSKLDWMLGVFYWNAKAQFDPFNLRINGNPLFNRITGDPWQKTESIAPYGQATYEILTNTNLTVGARYTWEKRMVGGEQKAFTAGGAQFGPTTTAPIPEISFGSFTWRVALDHKFSRDAMIYASYNRGFKSGGFSVLEFTAAPYKPETLDAYEAGWKTTILDGKATFNGAAFYYDYKDIQVYGQTTTGLIITNGGKGWIKGFELEFAAKPVPQLTLTAAYTYLDSKWVSFPNAQINTPNPAGGQVQTIGSVAGNQLPNAPHSVIALSGSYDIPIGDNKLSLSGNYYHNSGYFGEPDNTARQNAYDLVNASIRFSLPKDLFSITVWGRNLTDEAVNVYPAATSQVIRGFTSQRASYAPPRTFGATLGVKF